MTSTLKICVKCKSEQKRTEFYSDKSCADKLAPWCKLCTAEYHKTRMLSQKNIEKRRESYRKFMSKPGSKEKALKASNRWHKKNRTYVNKKRKDYTSKNKELISFIDKNARAKRKKAFCDGSVSVSFLRDLKLQTNICELCGISVKDKSFDLDHILPINAGGQHVPNNLRYICYSCNRSRPSDGSDLIGTRHEHLLYLNNKNIMPCLTQVH